VSELLRFRFPTEIFSIPSNIEQTRKGLICSIEPIQGINMEQHAAWRFEVNNPLKSTEWQPLWQIDEDQLVASQELKDELNSINAPVQLRIVRDSK